MKEKGTETNFANEYKEDDNPDGPEDHNNTTNLDNMDCLKIDDEKTYVWWIVDQLTQSNIRKNGYHIETMDEGESEYLLITNISSGKKNVLEKLSMYSSGLYYTKISAIETNMKFMDQENFILWHDRLGHPGSVMMRKIIEQSCGHPLENQKILQTKDMTCVACSKRKLITRPSPAKVGFETLNFLETI
ncbi:hypothetical protein OSB04_010921 [Centaurea solstitialis]|uniref:GAG-pre-integrase domain-containing protein n=1 Tax=Centaurea solstitialis TaxID=347529 RepID=A0AA38WD87_9ASTR|nr:hypothetical protein OSB04_010921 [Centaurea solstitialis]